MIYDIAEAKYRLESLLCGLERVKIHLEDRNG